MSAVFDPSETVPLWELVQTSHLVARGFTEVFATVGLSPTQFGILANLASDTGLTQAELARRVLVRPQSLGELLPPLLDRGLVRRHGLAGRGRRVGIELTDLGRDALERVAPGVRAYTEPTAIGLSAEEADTLVRLLRSVRRALSGSE